MGFKEEFPTVSLLLGADKADSLELHANDLAGKSHEEAVEHSDTCFHRHWCALHTTPECRDELERIEWSLSRILGCSAIDEVKLRNAFAIKSVNPDQFDQLVAEIATAVACVEKAKLIDLEWLTGKGNCDADVRCEIDGEAVNLEVTLRTDGWLDAVAVHMEDLFDEDGIQIAEAPAAKSRRTLTERQWEDLQDAGLEAPKRVSDLIDEARNNPRQMRFISDPDDMPEEPKPVAYCADGDNEQVESRNLHRCIEDKAKKFNADGFHVVVLATLRPGFPDEDSVFDTVFGQYPQIKLHGLFESGLHDEICGVLFLPVYQQLDRLKGPDDSETLAVFFPNHNAKCRPTEELELQCAKVFNAKIRRGWLEEAGSESVE